MQKLIITLSLVFLSLSLTAQVGEIQGKIKDMEMNGEGLPFANVYVEVNGIPRGTAADMDGFYSLKPLPPGMYKITVEYVGYTTLTKDSVIVQADKSTFVDFEMSENPEMLKEVIVTHYPPCCFITQQHNINFKINGKWRKPISNASLKFSKIYPSRRNLQSNEKGEIQFTLSKGNYEIFITHPDYKTYEGTIKISGDITQTFKLKKKRRKGK